MRRGKLEGIIITIPIFEDEGQGHKVVKWKGAQEYQPSAEQCSNNVIADIETKDFPAELKMFYRNLAAIFSVFPVTNLLLKRRNKQKDNKNKLVDVAKSKKDFGDGFSSDDKKMIIHGIYHSMNKFDDITIYSAKGSIGIETYIKILQDESWKHYVEEKMITDPFESENEVVKFINSSVVKIVNKLHKKD